MNDVSRRSLLGGGLLAAGAIGVGAGVGVLSGDGTSKRSDRTSAGDTSSAGTGSSAGGGVPLARNPLLTAAIERETALLAFLDGTGPSAAAAAVLRTDHEAHRQALRALLASAGPSTGTDSAGADSAGPNSAAASTAGSAPTATPVRRTVADLITHEKAAAHAAARDCAAAPPALAALLASISACEATHAAWLA